MGWRCRCSEQRCLRSTFSTTRVAGAVREGGQIDVRPDPDFVARVVETRRRCDAGGDRDREEQEREEERESATAREEREGVDGVWVRRRR